jgi:4-amino-4-deoxy-L-arabinose transferase-like glycosyltransferase
VVLEQTTTPARLTAPTARKLPRQALLWVGLAYVLFGLFFRDAWKTDDAAGLATILTAFNEGGKALLVPYIGNYPFVEQGPLLMWIAYIFEWIFSPLFGLWMSPLDAQITAARLPNLLYFYIVLYGVWYGCYLLARRPECQPLPLPFGGEPDPRDYGRMLADCAFLFLVACFGIIMRTHETTYIPLLMACHALGFYGFVRIFELPRQALFFLVAGISGSFLAAGLVGVFPLLFATLCLLFYRYYNSAQKRIIFIALVVSIAIALCWLLTVSSSQADWLSAWLSHNQTAFSGFGRSFLNALRDLAWFLLPLWPFALYAIWQWRRWFMAPHIFIPTIVIIGNLALLLVLRSSFEPEYSPLAVPTAVLAAMSIPTLRRNLINALDWYSIMVNTLSMIVIWLGWTALYLGWPSKIHDNIARLVPGFEIEIRWWAVLFGLAISALWILAINWRLRLKPEALWRGIVLFAIGLTVSWILIVTLWMPAVNYNRSYNTVSYELAEAIKEHVPADECIRSIGLGAGQSALFYIYGKTSVSPDSNCPWLLTQTNEKRQVDLDILYSRLPQGDHFSSGQTVWQGSRDSDRHGEVFRLISLPEPFQ